MKLTTSFISKTKQIYAKTLTASEKHLKYRQCHLGYFSKLYPCQQLFANKHKNEIVQYLQNYKYQDVNQGHFRKPMQGSTNVKKNDYSKTAHTFFMDHSILFLISFNCYNFHTASTKSVQLDFLDKAI